MKWSLPILFMLVASGPVWAVLPWGLTPAEDAMCKARVAGRDKSDTRNWMHMHHYCDGLRFYSRALASTTNRSDFSYYIKESIGGYDYVLRNTSQDFYMRPEVMAEKARTLSLAGRKAEAVSLYSTVVNQSPNFVPAYLFLADHYANSNRHKALELVIQGLRHNPDTKSLQRRYKELGGKLPYPEPIAKATPYPVESPQTTPVTPAAPALNADGPVQLDPKTSPPEISPTQIGTPKNPYCRFCTD